MSLNKIYNRSYIILQIKNIFNININIKDTDW